VDIKLVLIVIAFVLALPIGEFLASLVSLRRARLLAYLGAAVGAGLIAAGVYWFAKQIQIDGLTYFVGAFFAATTGAVIGAMVANFLVGLGDRRGRSVHVEI
jgi:hypothetical protein